MRLAIALGLSCWAGCFSDRGLAIEVDVGGLSATSIELYVGNEACEPGNAAGIACKAGLEPPVRDLSHRLGGDVWFRHDAVPYVAEVHGGTATFRLEADDTTTLPIVVVVGIVGDERVGTSTLHDVEVPAGASRVVTTVLTRASSIFADSSTAGNEERVVTWRAANDAKQSCLAIEHWSGGNVMRDFIVPPDDPDCDGLTDEAKECEPAVYRATNVPTSGPPTCFADTAASGPCTLGVPACSDGEGVDPESCVAAADRVCVPKRFCECTGDPTDSTCVRGRIDDNDVKVPHVHCKVPVGLIDNVACEATSVPINLDAHFAGPDGDCRPIALRALALDALSDGPTPRFNGVEIEVIDDHAPCTFRLHVKGGKALANERSYGLIRLDQHETSLLLPVSFETLMPAACVLQQVMICDPVTVDSDPMWTCGAGTGRK